MTFNPDPRINPVVVPVVARFRSKMNFEPEGYTLYTSAAVQASAQAIERAGDTAVDTVAAALKKGASRPF